MAADRAGPVAAVRVAVDVLIVAHNSRAVLADCLSSIETNRPPAGEIDLRLHVYDNGSTDGTPDMVAARFPRVQLHSSPANRGFAAANNELARQATGDYIMLLNPDTVWHSDVVTPLLNALRTRRDAVLAAPRLVYPDGSQQLSSQRLPTLGYELACALKGTRAARLPGLPDATAVISHIRDVHAHLRAGVHESEFVWATCWLLRGAWVAEHGLFDERLPLYDEDLEFCDRLLRQGFTALYLPSVELVHIGGASSDPVSKRVLVENARSRYYALSRGNAAAFAYRGVILPLNRFRLRRLQGR